MKKTLIALSILATLASCVGKKKYAASQNQVAQLEAQLQRAKADCDQQIARLTQDLRSRTDEVGSRDARVKELEEQLAYLKRTNTNLLDRLSDLSVISKSGAESIKKSLDALNDQSKYIKDLNTGIQRKDSMNLALVMNLKRSLSDINDQDVTVEVKKGVVYVSLSDKMLFRTGSYDINPEAKNVIGKVAKILNDYQDLEILVEGHTDKVPYRGDAGVDNWDLSVKRATSVTRLLQNEFSIAPSRMLAGGRGEHLPKDSGDSVESRRANRRTEIIILPKLDQFFNLAVPASASAER
jgi:chemotaxis protein MotB